MTEEQKQLTQEVIIRYDLLLKMGIPNPYNLSSEEWVKEINEKIEELKKKISK